MSDLQKYIDERKARDPEFEKGFDSGYEKFKKDAVTKRVRPEVGVSEEDVQRRQVDTNADGEKKK